ncbi:hypothetical protein CPB86DRAFT_779824 [Serendipita vermifera]|nr:hypothetical protein CPB86DRAFT_779824 [Serendipita vermifera]
MEGVQDEKMRYDYSYKFSLPHVVKARLDADIPQANAFAITTVLFPGVLVTLAQLIVDNKSNAPAWRALRFFMYCSILLNLSGTTIALVIIKMCTDLHYRAYRIVISDPASVPARLPKEGLSKHRLLDHYQLLEEFGMPWGYRVLDIGAGFWAIFGNAFTLVSFIMWVWLSGDTLIASLTMVVTIPPVFGVAYAMLLTKQLYP